MIEFRNAKIVAQLKAHAAVASRNENNVITINELIARLENENIDEPDVRAIATFIYGDSPKILAHLEDRIFAGLRSNVAKEWPMRFMLAIKPKSDLSLVGWKFLHWLLTDKNINPGIEHVLVRDVVQRCASIIASLAYGGVADIEEAKAAAAEAVRIAKAEAEAAAEAAAAAKAAERAVVLAKAWVEAKAAVREAAAAARAATRVTKAVAAMAAAKTAAHAALAAAAAARVAKTAAEAGATAELVEAWEAARAEMVWEEERALAELARAARVEMAVMAVATAEAAAEVAGATGTAAMTAMRAEMVMLREVVQAKERAQAQEESVWSQMADKLIELIEAAPIRI